MCVDKPRNCGVIFWQRVVNYLPITRQILRNIYPKYLLFISQLFFWGMVSADAPPPYTDREPLLNNSQPQPFLIQPGQIGGVCLGSLTDQITQHYLPSRVYKAAIFNDTERFNALDIASSDGKTMLLRISPIANKTIIA